MTPDDEIELYQLFVVFRLVKRRPNMMKTVICRRALGLHCSMYCAVNILRLGLLYSRPTLYYITVYRVYRISSTVLKTTFHHSIRNLRITADTKFNYLVQEKTDLACADARAAKSDHANSCNCV